MHPSRVQTLRPTGARATATLEEGEKREASHEEGLADILCVRQSASWLKEW